MRCETRYRRLIRETPRHEIEMSKPRNTDGQKGVGAGKKCQFLIRLSSEAAAAIERLTTRLATSRQIANVTATEAARGAVEAVLRIADADADLAIRLLDGAQPNETEISAHAPAAASMPRMTIEPGIDATRDLLSDAIAVSSQLRDRLGQALSAPSSSQVFAELATIRIQHERGMADVLDHARQMVTRVRAATVAVHNFDPEPEEEDLAEDDEEAVP
ncbi:hypothetical protein ACLF3G_27205 [Falsiroseomonas sp. HC035]|uniref:hypothetical protein n=1 Tax=Falsiroseomonas sp. HC035 TaxID=3390999 RepID=UPI003D32114C